MSVTSRKCWRALSQETSVLDGTSVLELVFVDPTHSADVFLSLDLLDHI